MDTAQDETPLTERKVVRRGLLAGLAGLSAAVAMKVTGTGKAEATDGVALVIGDDTQTSHSETRLSASPSLNGPVLLVANGGSMENRISAITAVTGTAEAALFARNTSASGGMGVNGESTAVGGIGVRGFTFNTNAVAVQGVLGGAQPGVAVEALSQNANAIAVNARAQFNGTAIVGVSSDGNTDAVTGSGIGVNGKSGSGSGVVGESLTSFGVRGIGATNSTGVKGVSNAAGSFGADGNGTGIGVNGRSAGGRGVFGEATSGGVGVQGYNNSSVSNSDGQGTNIGVLGKTGSGVGVRGESTSGIAIMGGTVSGYGVMGTSSTGIGVEGQGINAASQGGVRGLHTQNGVGVRGVSNAAGSATADGNGTGIGVLGKSYGGPGVKGESTDASGVVGVSLNQPGIDGTSTNSLGIRGTSTNFVGLLGLSTNNHGLYGSTHGANAFGIVAENVGGGPGLLVTGNAQIFGALQVFGVKNAVIKMADGSNAAVYCQESPEPYFEDFGRAQLAGGVANVQLEREFATLVAGGDYHVFTEPEGETRGIYISRRGPGGFEVREVGGGTGNAPFSYRIVTKRKDVDGRRFARVSTQAADKVAGVRAVLASMPTPGSNSPTTPQPGAPAPTPGFTVGPGLTVQQPPPGPTNGAR